MRKHITIKRFFSLLRKGIPLYFVLIAGLLVSCQIQAQSLHKLLRKGNKLYDDQSYTDAEAYYKKALIRDSTSGIGLFNLGNALYHQKRYKEAAKRYEQNLQDKALNKKEFSSSQYNMGNTYMQDKNWGKAIESYKKSLLANPKDDEARYNLAYAKAMQQKNKKGGGGKNNQKNKNQKDQKQKDQKDQDQDQEKNQKDQQKNQQQKQPQDKDQKKEEGKPQPQPEKMDKQRADQLLNAAAQHEKKIREKKDEKKKGVKVYKGKQW